MATPLAGTEAVLGDRRARVATPPAGAAAAGRARASSSTEAITSEEAPGAETVGTFLGMVVTRTPVSAPRAIPAPPDVLPDGAADRPTPAKRRRRWLRTASIVGTVVLAVAAAVALIATRESAPAPGALGADTAVRLPGSGSDIVARANELAAQGDKDGALDLLLRAHRQAPDSAGLSYAAGRIYFSKYHWSDGLRSFREAIRLDPSYRSDPELIKTVLRGFVLTPSYNDDLAAFLHDDIGDAVRPMLEETARSHPNASIRTRATNELRRYH
jgi:tetratricopeptide (TPR) repeat protein